MAFLSKILFKPNKVLEILSVVCSYYVFDGSLCSSGEEAQTLFTSNNTYSEIFLFP